MVGNYVLEQVCFSLLFSVHYFVLFLVWHHNLIFFLISALGTNRLVPVVFPASIRTGWRLGVEVYYVLLSPQPNYSFVLLKFQASFKFLKVQYRMNKKEKKPKTFNVDHCHTYCLLLSVFYCLLACSDLSPKRPTVCVCVFECGWLGNRDIYRIPSPCCNHDNHSAGRAACLTQKHTHALANTPTCTHTTLPDNLDIESGREMYIVDSSLRPRKVLITSHRSTVIFPAA